jgi:hypothetical protein
MASSASLRVNPLLVCSPLPILRSNCLKQARFLASGDIAIDITGTEGDRSAELSPSAVVIDTGSFYVTRGLASAQACIASMEWVGWMLSPFGVIETFNEQVWKCLTNKGWSH